MNNFTGSYFQLNFNSTSNSEDRVKIHKKKIIPQKDEINSRREYDDNEWEQEYYIIYNSYVLEEPE